jgi:hypothetical protein
MRILNFFLQLTGYLNIRKLFLICMFVVKASGKWDLHIRFTFLQEFSPPHIRKYLIFFCLIYVAMSNNQYSARDNVQLTCKRISNEVSCKITFRKRHDYIEIGWPWIWNQCFYLWIWNDDRTKVIVLPSFHFATRFNSQNANETEILMNCDTLICLWILNFQLA